MSSAALRLPQPAALAVRHGLPPPPALLRLRQGCAQRCLVVWGAAAQAAAPEEQPTSSSEQSAAQLLLELELELEDRSMPKLTREQRWWATLEEMERFKARHGRFPLRSEGRLAHWINNQRRAYMQLQCNKSPRRYITHERIAALEAVDGWSWDPLEDQWWEMHQRLCAFVQQHRRLPRQKEGELGSWVHNQRATYAAWQQGKPVSHKMTDERAAALEAVPGWSWDPFDDQWQEMYQQLRAFVQQHGRLPKAKEGEVGTWADTQRQAYAAWQQGEPGTTKMTEERAAALEAVPGWTWDPLEARWQERYQQLRAFVQQHGRLPMKRDGQLGTWVSNRRVAHRAFLRGTTDARRLRGMTADRAAALADVPGWIEMLEQRA